MPFWLSPQAHHTYHNHHTHHTYHTYHTHHTYQTHLTQLTTGLLLLGCADWVQHLFDSANVGILTAIFFVFVLLAATQVSSGGLLHPCCMPLVHALFTVLCVWPATAHGCALGVFISGTVGRLKSSHLCSGCCQGAITACHAFCLCPCWAEIDARGVIETVCLSSVPARYLL